MVENSGTEQEQAYSQEGEKSVETGNLKGGKWPKWKNSDTKTARS